MSIIVRFLKMVYTGMLRYCCTNKIQSVKLHGQDMGDGTYQALRASIYYANQETADGKPCFCVLVRKVAEGDDAELLDDVHTRDTDGALYAKEEEVHVELSA